MLPLKLCVALCLIFTACTVSACGRGWSKYNNKCYRLVEGSIGTLSDADRHCGQLRSRILTIHSQDEQQYLEKLLFKNLSVDQNVWIGGQRQNLYFAWRNDGILLNSHVYTNWAENKPSKVFAKACLQMNSLEAANPGKWSDNYCFVMNAIVCERPDLGNSPDNDNDDDDNDEHHSGNNGNCCDKFQNQLEKLEKNLEKKIDRLESELDKRDNTIDQLKDKLNDVSNELKSVKQSLKAQQNKVNNLEKMIDSFMDRDLREIRHNFTSVAGVFDYYNTELGKLSRQVNQLSSGHSDNSQHSGNSHQSEVDIGELKDDLKEYINQKLNEQNDQRRDTVVNDAKLSYVNYRRALMIQRNGKWIQLGYV